MLGKFFKNLGIFLLGMIFGVVALAGGMYLIISTTKLEKLTGYIPNSEEYISAELEQYTVLEAVKLLSDSSKTVGDYAELVPILDKVIKENLGSGMIADYVAIDFDKLYALTLSGIGEGIGGAISVAATLDGLSSTLSFTLPDLPLFNSVDTYVKITDDSFTITNNFYKDKTDVIFYIDSANKYVSAYDASGTLKASAAGQPLYYKSAGINGIPITDAVTALSSSLDFDNLTVGDLGEKFGVDILGEDELMNKLFSKDDVITSLANDISGKINALKVSDFVTIAEGDMLSKILGTGDSELTIGDLSDNDVLQGKINALKVSDFVTIAEGDMLSKILGTGDSELTIGDLSDNDVLQGKINALKVSDFVTITEGDMLSKILGTGDNELTIGDLSNDAKLTERIDALSLSEFGITFTSGSTIEAILGDNPTVGTLKDMNFDEKINSLTVGELGLNFTEDSLASKVLKPTDTVADLKTAEFLQERINGLTLDELGLSFTDGSLASKVLKPTDTVADLKTTEFLQNRINGLTLIDDLGIKVTGLVEKIILPTDTVGSITADGFSFEDRIDTIKISDLGIDVSTGLISKILSADDTVANLKTEGYLNNKIDQISIKDIGISTEGVIGNILLPTDTIGSLKTADLSGRVDNLELGELITITETSHNLLQAMKDTTVADMGEKISNLTVIDVFGENSTGIMKELLYKHDATGEVTTTPTKIDEISDEIKYVKLSSVITVTPGENAILDAIIAQDATLVNINSVIADLSLSDVFPNVKVFEKPTTINAEKMRFTMLDGVYTQDANGTYQISSTAGVWLLMMYNKTGTVGSLVYTETDIKLLDMADKVDSVTNTFKQATMLELYEIGFITTKPGTTFANMTLDDFISAASSVMGGN